MKPYFKWVNTARGIGIILVVMGHALTDTLGAADGSISKLLFDLIYSFHMPLFFFLSGFVGAKAMDMYILKDKANYIFSRFKRLMIPYFFVGALYIPLKLVLSSEVNTKIDFQTLPFDFLVGYNPNYQLWTLYALFISAAIIAIFAFPKKEYKWIILTVAVIMNVFWAVSYCPINVLNEVTFQFLFYVLGVLYRKHGSFDKLPTAMLIISTILFATANVLNQIYAIDFLKTITAVTGIIIVCEMCKRFESMETPIFDIVGKYGMDIYIMANLVQVLIRSVFLNRLHLPGIACFFMSVIFGVSIPILVSKYIVRKFRITRILVLGDFSKTNKTDNK
ncbi:MAG: acyltransferase family protein [Clostridia bacterium]